MNLTWQVWYACNCFRTSVLRWCKNFCWATTDAEGEGETEFLYEKIRVQPKKGLGLVFPAGWLASSKPAHEENRFHCRSPDRWDKRQDKAHNEHRPRLYLRQERDLMQSMKWTWLIKGDPVKCHVDRIVVSYASPEIAVSHSVQWYDVLNDTKSPAPIVPQKAFRRVIAQWALATDSAKPTQWFLHAMNDPMQR